MDIIGGAIERIDNPRRRPIGAGGGLGRIVLLTGGAVLGKPVAQVIADGLLGSNIGFGHQIESSFLSDAETPPPVLQNGSGPPSSFLGSIDIIRKSLGGSHAIP